MTVSLLPCVEVTHSTFPTELHVTMFKLSFLVETAFGSIFTPAQTHATPPSKKKSDACHASTKLQVLSLIVCFWCALYLQYLKKQMLHVKELSFQQLPCRHNMGWIISETYWSPDRLFLFLGWILAPRPLLINSYPVDELKRPCLGALTDLKLSVNMLDVTVKRWEIRRLSVPLIIIYSKMTVTQQARTTCMSQ